MSTHSAKTAALMAYDLGVLSDAGGARLERHLAGCSVCAGELAAIRTYEALSTEAREQHWPEPAWDKMELALRREAKEVASASRRERAGVRHALYGLLAAAAVIALAVTGGRLWPETAEPAPTRTPVVDLAALDGAPRDGTVTAIAGHATDDGHELALGDVVSEGDLITTSPSSTMHVRLGDGTGFVLAANSSARLDRSRARATLLTLDGGRVTSRVAHLEEGARYEVYAAPYVIHVRGTHFTVSRSTDAAGTPTVTVTVREGVVEVTEGDAIVARVVGPNRWSAPPGETAMHPMLLVEPVATAPGGTAWPMLRIPAVEGISKVALDGLEFPLSGALAMRASLGTHEGLAFGLSGVPVPFTIEVGPEGASLDPTLMFVRAVDDGPRRGSLDPAVVRDVVTRGMDGVQRCYRTALMRRPDVAGHMSLRITVDSSGRVGRAALTTQGAPYPWLSSCVENQASAWTFPAPTGGGPVSLSVPLDFAMR